MSPILKELPLLLRIKHHLIGDSLNLSWIWLGLTRRRPKPELIYNDLLARGSGGGGCHANLPTCLTNCGKYTLGLIPRALRRTFCWRLNLKYRLPRLQFEPAVCLSGGSSRALGTAEKPPPLGCEEQFVIISHCCHLSATEWMCGACILCVRTPATGSGDAYLFSLSLSLSVYLSC